MCFSFCLAWVAGGEFDWSINQSISIDSNIDWCFLGVFLVNLVMMEGGEGEEEINAKLRMEVVKDDKAEAIHLAIQKLMEDEKRKKKKKNTAISDGDVDEDEEDRLLLSRLLSQLESIKEDNTTKLPEPSTETMEQHSSADGNGETKDESRGESSEGSREVSTEEILKELKKVKKQNSITHCLLSVLIALTLAWQLSEVSILMKVKRKLSNPFKSVQNLITDITKASASPIEPPPFPIPALEMPDFPHMDLPALGLNAGEE